MAGAIIRKERKIKNKVEGAVICALRAKQERVLDFLIIPSKYQEQSHDNLFRIKSAFTDCWLDIRKKRYPRTYEDGSPAGGRQDYYL